MTPEVAAPFLAWATAVRGAFVIVACLVAAVAPAAGADGPLLPAYSHNDYENDRPLADALGLGYRGVEADVFLVGGELRVAHERDQTVPGRTLAALYLEPLRELVARNGAVLADGTTFLLNVEAKEPGRATYDAVRAELARFATILAVVVDGEVQPGPVQVVLVGHHPPLAELAAESPRYAAVQCRYDDLPEDHAMLPAHLLRMVSVRYPDTFDWMDDEASPPGFGRELGAIRDAAHAVPGRLLRVFAVPSQPRVYAELLDGGVDLIGTKNLERSRRLLRVATPRRPAGDGTATADRSRPCP